MSGPVDAGLCSYPDIYRLSMEDFCNMNEILAVKYENQRRADKAAKAAAANRR